MTITFGTAGVFGVSTTASVTPALPASLAQNEFMFAHVNVQTSTSMGTRGDGWNLLSPPVANAEAPAFLFHTYWKFAGASESAPTFSSASALVMGGVISRWPGVPVSANPFNITPTTHQGSGTTMAGNNNTSTVNNCLAIWAWGQDDNGVTSTVTNSATVAFGGASYNTTSGGGCNISVAYKLITPAGATGVTSMTSASGTQNMHVLAILDPTVPPSAQQSPIVMPSMAAMQASIW